MHGVGFTCAHAVCPRMSPEEEEEEEREEASTAAVNFVVVVYSDDSSFSGFVSFVIASFLSVTVPLPPSGEAGVNSHSDVNGAESQKCRNILIFHFARLLCNLDLFLL